jgi:hypothetical protein
MSRRLSGRRIWLQGSQEQAAEAGTQTHDPWATGCWRAPFGDFHAERAGRAPEPREGSFQVPTPDFLSALPRDPRQLLDRLRADSPDDRPGYSGAFVYATDLLRTGLAPADLRTALYRALGVMPATQVTEPPDMAEGQDLALSIDDGHRRLEIFLDRSNGQFSGERSTIVRDMHGLKAGTVTTSSVVSITTVDGPIDCGQL